MLAMPEGMLVIDQDNDDGGREAIAALAGQLGGLPVTLSHDTPHGSHRIYRTPQGWKGRAWVGKDARNPLPAGIDLRVPGQILMAAPSRVPAEGRLVSYGPVTDAVVADLPRAYVAGWTPTPAQPTAQRPRIPVPPGRTDAAAAYVHARISGIVEDLAALPPGGRNTAIYTAALKVGSTIGAARATPGAEHAAADWTDEAAEETLLVAAERNGYIADHRTAAARAAISSGLRNGLRSPRPLPDFNSRQIRATEPERLSSAAPGNVAVRGRAADRQSERDMPDEDSQVPHGFRSMLARDSQPDQCLAYQGSSPGWPHRPALHKHLGASAPDRVRDQVDTDASGPASATRQRAAGPDPPARPYSARQADSPDWRDAVITSGHDAWQPDSAARVRVMPPEARGSESEPWPA